MIETNRGTRNRIGIIATLGLVLGAAVSAQPANLPVVAPVAECPALAGADISGAVGAPAEAE